ncbi:unnamed protein product [Ectocarpus sp. 12 AP-2014]
MDSLTARVISTSGLSRAYPLLPPVHNIGMIYLKEPFGDAEIFLHEARVALDNFEKNDSSANKQALYDAMAKLEVKEAHYFGTTRLGFNKPMFVGWRKELFKAKIREMITKTTARKNGATTLHRLALFSASKCVEAWTKISGNLFQRRQAALYISTRVTAIENALGAVGRLQTSDATRQPSLKIAADSLRDAKACQRLESLIAKDQWILPHDLGV